MLTLILSSGVCLADNYVGGIPLTSVQIGTVDGGVYCDSYYGTGTQAIHTVKTIDKTFTLPTDAEVEWAMLLTTVYCGHMQNNYKGTANVSLNGQTLGNETLSVPFTYVFNEGDGYVQVNDHVNRVTSDYMMYYDVTSLVKAGENTAAVNTAPLDNSFDGRVKLITLVVAYNDGSGNKIRYQVNRGHDTDTYYSDDELEENYVGNTAFEASLPEGVSLADAELTVVHMASTDGTYTFNGNLLASGIPQGTYTGSNTWDVKDSFNSGTNTLTYDRAAGFYKNTLGILTAEYTESQLSAPVADFSANVISGTEPLTVQFTDASTGTVSSYSWDFNNDGSIDSTAQNPSYTYTSAGTYTVNLTVTNAGGSDSEVKAGYITVNAAATNDLTISGIVNTVPSSAVFAREANPVKVNSVKNTGSSALTNISVALYASDVSSTVPVNTTTIESLAGGGSTSVTLIDPTIRNLEGGTVTYTAVVDPENLISETNETNNNKSSAAKSVKYNGYKGKRYWEGGSDITTMQTYDIYGNVIYSTQPSSAYKSVGWTDRTETWAESDFPIPDGSTVDKVLLYVAYNWDTTAGGVPDWTASFNGNSLANGALYTDKSNFGGYADYMYGLYVFDITSQFSPTGNTLVMKPNTGNSNALYPSTLVVIYQNPAETRKQIFINEECDELAYSEFSYGTTVEEATAYAPFTGMSIDSNTVKDAKLHSFAGSAGPGEGNLLFNGNVVATDAWQGDSGTSNARIFDVKNFLNATGNEAGIQGTTSGGMAALQQILVIEYPAAAPVAAFTAAPTSGDAPLAVKFTDASTGTISSYEWDFNNDGEVDSNEQTPSYTYASAGTYGVNLTVTGPGGSDSEVKEEYVSVSEPLPAAPVANFSANVTTGTLPLTVQFTDASAGAPTGWKWDFENDGKVDSTEQNPSHTYTSAGIHTVNLTVTNSGGSDLEVKADYITVNESMSQVDLTIAGTVNPVPASAVFAREPNPVKITNIKNNGPGTATSIHVYLYASDVSSGTVPINSTVIESLASGAQTTITLIDPTIRDLEGGRVTYTSTVDPNNLIAETNETNNNKSITKDVKYNGYKGKRYWESGSDITTRQTYDIQGDLVYFTQPESAYKSVGWTTRTETWTSADLPIPSNATVEKVLLYFSYNWDQTSGGLPDLVTTFNGNTITLGTPYTDKSNFGAYANHKYGLYPAVDVTSLFVRNGDNTLVTTPGTGNVNALYPSTLVVIYSDPAETRKQIFINEGCDELGYSESSYGTTLEEATAYAPFTGISIDVSTVKDAKLHSFAGSAGPDEGNLLFNGNVVAADAWQGDSSSSNARVFDVKNYLNETGNEAGIQGTTTGGMAALQQILVIEYPATVPVADFSANVISGNAPLEVKFTDASSGTILSYAWDFDNDGSIDSNEQSPSHTYVTAGTYTVKLTVANAGGRDEEVKTGYITVSEPLPELPVADFSANVTSGDAPLEVQFTDVSTGIVSSYAWDFNNDGQVDSNEQSPSYTYSTVGNYSVKLIVTNAGGSDEELKTDYIKVTELPVPEPDLIVLSITLNSGEIFANKANAISAKVENSGSSAAGPFTVIFNVNGVGINATVDSLSAGANTTLSITDPTIRDYGDSVEVTVTADSENSVSESDEANNTLSLAKTVVYNGYKGKRLTDGDDINTRETFEGKYDVIYSRGDSAYSPAKWLSVTDTWTSSDLAIPADATVVSARLYQPYAYNRMSVDPAFTAAFNNITISADSTYKDTKGFDGYNYPYGLYVYNVTDQFSKAGNTLTLTPEGTPGTTNDYSVWGAYLVVVYSDPATTGKQIFINDEFDMLYSRSSYSVTSEEATAFADFSGVNSDNANNAEVIAILASAGDSGKSKFFFNDKEYTGFWADYHASSQIGFSVYNITDELANGANEAGFQSYDPGTGGDNMYAMNAILVVEYPEPVPVADFTVSTTSGAAPLTVMFTDSSTGTVTSRAWDFDSDGTVDSYEQNPSYTYSSAGTYTVNLTVIGPGGSDSEVKEGYIAVIESLPESPVANFSANETSGTAPTTVQFTDTSTGAPTSWQWDFNNDGVVDSTGQTPVHTYETAGTYTVKLIVANAGGSDDEVKTGYIVVSEPLPAPPVAAFTATPTSGNSPLTVQFTDESAGSPTSWAWDFDNDGSIDSTKQSSSYTYTSAGTYTVNLTVANAGGGTSEVKTDYISVSEPYTPTAPVAAFASDVTSGTAPLTVNFTDQSTDIPTSWLWDFGDGASAAEQNASHTYTSTGIYTVSLTVTNAGGSDSEIKTDYIAVSTPETPDTTKPVIESVVLFPANTTAGSTIDISVNATDNKEITEVTAGEVQLTKTDGVWKGSITAPSSPGDYSLRITAKDAAGNTAETSVTYRVVQLSGGANIAVSPRSSSVAAGNTVSLSIKVKNTQNIDDTFKVHISVSELPASYQADLSWFNWTEKVVTLKAGEEILVPMEVTVPKGAAAGRKLFRANVNSETSSITGFDTGYLAIS